MRRLTGAFLAVAGLAVLAVAAGFVGFARDATEIAAPADPHAEGIVVLTGGRARIDAGLRLLAEGRASRLLISGVNPAVTRTTLAESFGAAYGAALACCVDLGHAAQDTVGNAIETRQWADAQHFGSLLVVTSNYHMQRSMAELAETMPNVELTAFPISDPGHRPADWWNDPATFGLLAREYGKYLLTLARLTILPQPMATVRAGE
ncbi:MAG: YdcF family protein [Bauldia sp.]